MKIAFAEIEGWEDQPIRELLSDHSLLLAHEYIDSAHLPEQTDIDVLSVFVDSRIDEQVLHVLPQLKLIVARSTGYDHIDIDACAQRGIIVCNVPAYGSTTVAEYTIGLMVMLARRLYQATAQVKNAGSFALGDLRGMDLEGKTLGVIGTGRIGHEVITRASAFGMKITAYDPFPNKELQTTHHVVYASLDEVLAQSDIVTLHVPLNKDTHHILNAKNMKKMKQGAYVVNTARGELIETAALARLLQSGHLAGAGLDVLEAEGEIKHKLDFLSSQRGSASPDVLTNMLYNHALLDMPQVVVTPHNAFNSHEALLRILHETIVNITSYIDGTPQNTVSIPS
jgi:D-lactate dehydrogenase